MGVLKMKKITPIEQTTSTECGLCCLYMMLDYFDIPETYFNLKQQVDLGRYSVHFSLNRLVVSN